MSCLDSGEGGPFLAHSEVTHGVEHKQPVYTAADLAPSPGCTQKHLEYTLQLPSASGAHHSLEASMPVMSRVEHEIPCFS